MKINDFKQDVSHISRYAMLFTFGGGSSFRPSPPGSVAISTPFERRPVIQIKCPQTLTVNRQGAIYFILYISSAAIIIKYMENSIRATLFPRCDELAEILKQLFSFTSQFPF